MTIPSSDTARTSPSTARNREPILSVLRGALAPTARVLEVASGAGEHAVWMAQALPGVTWTPSEIDPVALASIAAWREASGLVNLQAPLRLDAGDPGSWPTESFDAIVCINMVHISPWTATRALVLAASRLLSVGGLLYLYGPYFEDGVETAASNLAFDESLRRRDPAWGLRRVRDVADLAAQAGFSRPDRVAMPANNLSLLFTRAPD